MQLAYEQWISLSKLRAPPAPAQRLVPVRSYSPPGSGISGTALSEKARLSAVTATTADVKSGLVAGPGLEGAGEQQRRVPDEEPPILKEEGPVPQENFTPQHDHVVDKILLVDDNHINIKVLGAYMKKLGRTYDVAVNGQEALDAYTRDPSRFAGIIMDISMPVMDGFEATRRIRAMERQHRYLSHDQSQGGRSPVAIVALTGLATDEAQQEAFASGVDIFLTKPVRLNVLQEMLESRFVWKQQGGE